MKSQFKKTQDYFISPTKGRLNFDSMIGEVVRFMADDPKSQYNLIVGTDSRAESSRAYFVTVLVMHRVGRGARYFWQGGKENKLYTLRDRIYKEAWLSLDLAGRFLQALEAKNNGIKALQYHFEIHVDIGTKGPTKDLIKEVVGMIEGNGFSVKMKPEAYGAMTVADRHT